METPSNQKSVSTDISPEKQPCTTIWRLSPIDKKGSSLYDSYELQAVTKQISRAINGSSSPLSPYSSYLKLSPFYLKGLDCISRENANAPKRISCSQLDGDIKACTRGTRGFVMRLWKKVKRGVVGSKLEK